MKFIILSVIIISLSANVGSTQDNVMFSTISNSISIDTGTDCTHIISPFYVFITGSTFTMEQKNILSGNWTVKRESEPTPWVHDTWKYPKKGIVSKTFNTSKSLEGQWNIFNDYTEGFQLCTFDVIMVDVHDTDHVLKYSNETVSFDCRKYLVNTKDISEVHVTWININSGLITVYNSTSVHKTFSIADSGSILGCVLVTETDSSSRSKIADMTVLRYCDCNEDDDTPVTLNIAGLNILMAVMALIILMLAICNSLCKATGCIFKNLFRLSCCFCKSEKK